MLLEISNLYLIAHHGSLSHLLSVFVYLWVVIWSIVTIRQKVVLQVELIRKDIETSKYKKKVLYAKFHIKEIFF